MSVWLRGWRFETWMREFDGYEAYARTRMVNAAAHGRQPHWIGRWDRLNRTTASKKLHVALGIALGGKDGWEGFAMIPQDRDWPDLFCIVLF